MKNGGGHFELELGGQYHCNLHTGCGIKRNSCAQIGK